MPEFFSIQALEQRRLFSVVTWIGPSGGLWNAPANWSGGVLPDSTSDVVISKSPTVQVNLSGNASVHSISVTGDTLNVSSGTLTLAANASIGAAATLTLNNAVLSLTSATTLTNSGTITLSAASQIAGSGAYSATSTGTMTLAGGVTASNLLSNPGFESPSAGTSTTTGPSGWGQWGSSYLSAAYAQSGSQSLVQSGSNSGVFQTFTVTAGTTYTASVNGLDPSASPLTGPQGGFLNISFMNSSGGTITGGQFVAVLSSSSATGSWINSTTSLTAPTAAVSAYVGLQVGAYVGGTTGTAGGLVYWDNVSFGVLGAAPATVAVASVNNSGSITLSAQSQLNVAGAYIQSNGASLTLNSATAGSGVGDNLVQNASFENPAAGTSTTTSPNNWATWGDSYVTAAYNHSGTQSLVQSGTNSGASQTFSVTPGVSYSVSANALDPANSPLTGDQGGFLNIFFSNSSGGTLSYGEQFITMVSQSSTVGSWLNYTDALTAPSGAASFTVLLQVGGYVGGQTGTQGGSVGWDDIAFGPTALNSAAVTASTLSNAGTITIGGGDTITDLGSFTQTTTGVFVSDLAGPAAGNNYGSLTAAETAILAGTLTATLINGYTPTINDGFSLITYPAETGTFTTYQLPTSSTYVFQPGTNPTYVGISAVPPSLTATINTAVKSTTATNNLIGANLAYWDGNTTTSQTQQLVQSAGLSILRFPGGSGSDDYHFNIQNNYGYSTVNIPQFAKFISQVGATGIVTVDYGAGSPQEAEAELAYLEGSPSDTTTIGTGIEWSDSANAWQNVNWQTVGYWASLRAAKTLSTDDGLNFLRINQIAPFTNIKDWEMGNEEYYSWENDHHGTAGPGGVSTGAQHDPATYTAFTAAFEYFDKITDPSLPQVNVGIDGASPLGSLDNNLMQTVVTDLYNDGKAAPYNLTNGLVPGFISDHVYMQNAGSESDLVLLNHTVSDPNSLLDWSNRYNDFEAMLKSVLGTQASYVQLMATEFNSTNGELGKQSTSLVDGIFVADSIGSLLNSGYTGGLVWDLSNGWDTNGNNSASLYGWRQGGDFGIIGAGQNTPPSTGTYVPYPAYFGEQISSKLIQTGGLDVSTASSYGQLTTYSVLEPNGHLDLMVLNKNPDSTLTEQFNLSGFTPSGAAQLWQYGEAQDYAQSQSTTGAAALASTSLNLTLTGNNFSYAFPAYSMSVIDLTPKLSVATPAAVVTNPGIVGTSVTLSSLGLENGGDSALTYTWAATGPGSATYSGSTNGTNAAKSILANFSVSGTYTLTVTIADPGNQTITSSVQELILPLFARQSASTLTINLNNIAPINLTDSTNTVTVTEEGYALSFNGITSVIVNGSATNNVLSVSGPLTAPFSFNAGATTTLNVQTGTLNIAAGSGSAINNQQFAALNILAGASVVLAKPANENGRTLLQTQTLTLAGGLGVWTSKLDLSGNDLEVTSGSYANINDQLKQGYNIGLGGIWQGSQGIVSSAAASNSTHLATLGMILNTVDGTPSGAALYSLAKPFDGTSPPASAILVKYTFYGDADLSGTVDGTDYSRIDSGFLHVSTGWYNGDFNYDQTVDGSDYTLIDNAFNTQTATITSQIANTAAQIKPSANRNALPQTYQTAAIRPGLFNGGTPIAASSLPWIDQVLGDLTYT
jgi:hypothetical protein